MRIGRIFGPKMEEVDNIGGYINLHMRSLVILYYFPSVIII
jgi:hypothetical protein